MTTKKNNHKIKTKMKMKNKKMAMKKEMNKMNQKKNQIWLICQNQWKKKYNQFQKQLMILIKKCLNSMQN